MKSGKLSPSDLQTRVFRYLGERRPEVLVHARLGEDCSVLDLGDDVLVVSTDPITGTAINIGRLSADHLVQRRRILRAEPIGLLVTLPGA